MLLYTIVPEEIVFKRSEDEIESTQEIVYGGKKMLVYPVGFKQFQVVQLISSDPNDFLDTELQPGSVITLKG